MSKRKTRKEKVIAQLRRKLSQTQVNSSTEIQSSVQKTTMYSFANSTTHGSSNSTIQANPYLYTDLIKTLTVTATIIGIELLLYIFLNSNSLKIPMVNF